MATTPGEQAETLIDLIDNEIKMCPDETCRRIIIGRLSRFCDAHDDAPCRPPPPAMSVMPMNEHQAKGFEAHTMTYGVHKEKLIADVPVSWLCWLVDPSYFRDAVKRYLLSDRGKLRIEQETDVVRAIVAPPLEIE